MNVKKKLTGMQEELMDWVNQCFFDGKDYFYCETGSCKPWSTKTVNALINKGFYLTMSFILIVILSAVLTSI